MQNQTSEILRDIKKLRTHEATFQETAQAPRGYVLVWNVTDVNQGTDIGPDEYASKLEEDGKKIAIWQTRVAPLSVKLPLPAKRDWSVENWLWLILAEVTQQEPGALQKKEE